jgi:hypothetical protein
MTYSTFDNYLLFAKKIIVKILRNHPKARVQTPSSDKIEEYRQMVWNRHQFLPDILCTMEGLKLMLEQSSNALIQEQYYNGWTHYHYVTSVLCFFQMELFWLCL